MTTIQQAEPDLQMGKAPAATESAAEDCTDTVAHDVPVEAEPADPNRSPGIPAFFVSGEGMGHLVNDGRIAVGVCVTGRTHLRRNIECEDAVGYASRGEWRIAIVCDGAGSTHYGGLASERTVRTILGYFDRHAESADIAGIENWVRDALSHSRKDLRDYAEESGVGLNKLSSTIVGALLRADNGLIFHIGDGAGIALHPNGESTVSRPQNGEYANETYFLSDEHWESNLRLLPVAGVTDLALMSDGVTPLALEQGVAFRGFLDPIRKTIASYPVDIAARAIHQLLSREDLAKKVDDDKSMVWITAANRQEAPVVPEDPQA
jgi:hypothetical protein